MQIDRSVQYVARRTFGYDASLDVDSGMVFKLRGYPADEKLVRLGYVLPLAGRVTPVECNRCGKKFVDLGALQMHGRMRHPDRDVTEEEMLERIEEFESKTAPLFMDRTAATLDGASAAHEAADTGKRARRFR